jgi:hypothetical protein
MGHGTNGITGILSSTNSRIGSTTGDFTTYSVILLTGNHYIIRLPSWDNGTAANAGAAVWGIDTRAMTGTIDSTNSLVGTMADDQVAMNITTFTNGYLVTYLRPGASKCRPIKLSKPYYGVSPIRLHKERYVALRIYPFRQNHKIRIKSTRFSGSS